MKEDNTSQKKEGNSNTDRTLIARRSESGEKKDHKRRSHSGSYKKDGKDSPDSLKTQG